MGDKPPRQPVGKLSQVTMALIKKRQNVKVLKSRDQIEFAELSKLITKKKVRDIQNCNVEKIDEAVKYGRSMKSVRGKFGIGQGKVYDLKDKHGNIISNFDDVVKAAEEFYTDLHSSRNSQATFIRSSDEPDTEAPSRNSDEVRRALKDMTRGKSAGEDGITVDLIKDGGDVMLEKLAALYTQGLKVYEKAARTPTLYASIRREKLEY